MEKSHYEKHKEELKEKKRLYRLNNAEKIKAYYIKYKNECPERLKEIRERAVKKWKEKHPEDYKRLNTERVKKNYERVKNNEEFKAKRREYARQYRERNREKKIEYLRQYRKRNRKEKVIIERKPIIICKGPIKISFD